VRSRCLHRADCAIAAAVGLWCRDRQTFVSVGARFSAACGWLGDGGAGTVEFADGWMTMKSPQEQMHHVFWCPETFPESFVAQWEMQNQHLEAGLCIVFFAATGMRRRPEIAKPWRSCWACGRNVVRAKQLGQLLYNGQSESGDCRLFPNTQLGRLR
jgi:hypothetical protein